MDGIHIEYQKAPLNKRVYARILDLFIGVAIGLLVYLGVRAIFTSLPDYQAKQSYVDTTMVESGLYIEEEDGQKRDAVTYISSLDLSSKQEMEEYENTITTFLDYVKTSEDGSEEKYETVQSDYDSYRLSLVQDDINLFVTEESTGEIIKNDDFKPEDRYQVYSDVCYKPYIDEHLRSYLVTLFPKYYEYNQYFTTIILWAEVPISVLIASLLVYFVPPLFLRRGRQTLGMLIYHVGKTNTDLLALKMGKYLLYSLIWNIGIILLSFYTLGLPLLISLTMMLVTKTKQDFPDYMLQLYEVDVTDSKIYYSLAEVADEHGITEKVKDSFQMEKKN